MAMTSTVNINKIKKSLISTDQTVKATGLHSAIEFIENSTHSKEQRIERLIANDICELLTETITSERTSLLLTLRLTSYLVQNKSFKDYANNILRQYGRVLINVSVGIDDDSREVFFETIKYLEAVVIGSLQYRTQDHITDETVRALISSMLPILSYQPLTLLESTLILQLLHSLLKIATKCNIASFELSLKAVHEIFNSVFSQHQHYIEEHILNLLLLIMDSLLNVITSQTELIEFSLCYFIETELFPALCKSNFTKETLFSFSLVVLRSLKLSNRSKTRLLRLLLTENLLRLILNRKDLISLTANNLLLFILASFNFDSKNAYNLDMNYQLIALDKIASADLLSNIEFVDEQCLPTIILYYSVLVENSQTQKVLALSLLNISLIINVVFLKQISIPNEIINLTVAIFTKLLYSCEHLQREDIIMKASTRLAMLFKALETSTPEDWHKMPPNKIRWIREMSIYSKGISSSLTSELLGRRIEINHEHMKYLSNNELVTFLCFSRYSIITSSNSSMLLQQRQLRKQEISKIRIFLNAQRKKNVERKLFIINVLKVQRYTSHEHFIPPAKSLRKNLSLRHENIHLKVGLIDFANLLLQKYLNS